MTKSEFDKCVSIVSDKCILDYHTYTKIMLFCDYLWREIEGNINEKNERDINTSSN